LGFEYRRQIEQQLGMPLPPQTDENGESVPMDPEIEARLAPMLAQAAQQLLGKNAQEMQAQQAQQQAQDPLVQLQAKEIAIKEADQQRKAAKDQADIALKASQQQIERDRIAAQQQTDAKRIQVDAIKAVTESRGSREDLMAKLSVDVLKHLSNKNQEEQNRTQNERQSMRQLPKPTKGE
jgi:hypothetical protein